LAITINVVSLLPEQAVSEPVKMTNPFRGQKGEIHFENETRFETILFYHLKDQVIKALLEAHPYEEVAYDLFSLENKNSVTGLGCIGEMTDLFLKTIF